MLYVERKPTANKVCLHFDDEVFIWSQEETIFVYSLKEDVWSVLETPPSQEPWVGGALGAWDGRVFLFSSLSLWELVDRAKSTWRKFATSTWRRLVHVPADIHAWLVPHCRPAFKAIEESESMPAFPRSMCSFTHWYVTLVLEHLREL
jgi:hypothetical protein